MQAIALTILRNQLADIHWIAQMSLARQNLSKALPYAHKIQVDN